MQPFRRRFLSLLALPALLAVTVTGAQARAHAPAGAALVKAASAHILVTSGGATLYIFAPDKPHKSTCYGTCAKVWPPLLVPKGASPAASMTGMAGTFGVAVRSDGTHQLTYDGAPLYTFLGDNKVGQMRGQGLTINGGYWWVVVTGGK